MAKLTDLPLIEAGDIDGSEQVAVVKDGATGRATMSTLAQPWVDEAYAYGVHPDPIGSDAAPFALKDAAGLALGVFDGTGDAYYEGMARPGPLLGYQDRIDVWAELEALKNAVQLSANATFLRSAVRNYGTFPAPLSMLDSDDEPTCTLGMAGANSAINGNTSYASNVGKSSAKLTWVSGPTANPAATFPYTNYFGNRGAYYGRNAANTADVRGSYAVVLEFLFSGDDMEVAFVGNGAGGANVRMLVDDVIAATESVPNATSSPYYWRVTWTTSRVRRIRIESRTTGIGGVNVADTAQVTNVSRSYPMLTALGDSFVEGAGYANTGNVEAFVFARRLGMKFGVTGVGGTGMLYPGGLNTAGGQKVAWHEATRLIDYTLAGVTDSSTGAAIRPDLGVIFGSLNDQAISSSYWTAYGATLQEALTNRALHCIDAFAAENPGIPQIIYSPTWPAGAPASPPTLDIYRLRDGYAEAASARASLGVYFVDRTNPQKREGISTDATAQASLYTGADGTHPTDAGHRYDGLYDAQLAMNIILGQMA